MSIHPEGNRQYTKPVVVLADRESVSAAEQFVLAMKTLPNVRQAGDTTAGAMSRLSFERQLPNGWLYWMSIQILTDTQGRTHEGAGLAPDVLVINTEDDFQNGRDRMLEKADEHTWVPANSIHLPVAPLLLFLSARTWPVIFRCNLMRQNRTQLSGRS